jgi:N-methylhydantoinase B
VPAPEAPDVILTTVLANRLDSICREMGSAMLRSARSSIFAENRDFATAIFDAQPRMVAQTAYIPILLGSTPWAVQAISDFFGDDVAEGDVMIFNDPYLGNNHLPDITVVRPVFRGGRVRFWMVTRGHHADIGGGGAGGYNPDARTAFEEGIRITPSKLYEAGRYNKSLWSMILANVRLPSLVEGDLQCQVGATRIGERAIHAVLDRYGDEIVAAAIEETITRSEAQVRALIQSLPDGTYRAERRLDRVSRGDQPHPAVRLALTIRGDQLHFDFTGSDREIPTFDNGTLANTFASCYNAFFSSIDPDIRLNAGSVRPITVNAPAGTIVNASSSAATTSCTTVLCAAIVEAAWMALGQAKPELGQGLWHRWSIASTSSGINPRTGMPFAVIHFFAKGGAGATAGFDGFDHLSSVASMGGSRAPDPELFELRSPHRIQRLELLGDSAGAGRWRGGHGVNYRVEFTSPGTTMVLRPSCFVPETAPLGTQGGEAAPLASATFHLAAGGEFPVVEPVLVRPAAGDVLDVHATGGGGFGDPRLRPPQAVLEDVRDGLLSIEKAERSYGVVVDPATGAVDAAATARRRQAVGADDGREPGG